MRSAITRWGATIHAMNEDLTLNELLALFGRTPEQTRWASSADSEEYLTLVTYLSERGSHRSQGIA